MHLLDIRFQTPVAQVAALLLPGLPCAPLRAARRELKARLHLAFRLASLHHRVVVLEPGAKSGRGLVSLQLPQEVAWGCPPAIPLPPNLEGSGWDRDCPRPITVMPEHRATANVWFLHHGREALCLCLGLKGTVELLRYRPLLGAWTPC
jgi:hypothetical protein